MFSDLKALLGRAEPTVAPLGVRFLLLSLQASLPLQVMTFRLDVSTDP